MAEVYIVIPVADASFSHDDSGQLQAHIVADDETIKQAIENYHQAKEAERQRLDTERQEKFNANQTSGDSDG